MSTLSLLGRPGGGAVSADGLEWFPAPVGVGVVDFSTDELTARCPVTEQPDYYRLEFVYKPGGRCLESKSVKLYLQGFRNEGIFCESLAVRILRDLVRAVEPVAASVRLRQAMRGGLSLGARADHNGGVYPDGGVR